MYGMSAKDRLALFEKKSTNDNKKGPSGPKKIGKLNVGGKKEEKEKPSVPEKKPKKDLKKTDDKPTVNNTAEIVQETPKDSKPKETIPEAEKKGTSDQKDKKADPKATENKDKFGSKVGKEDNKKIEEEKKEKKEDTGPKSSDTSSKVASKFGTKVTKDKKENKTETQEEKLSNGDIKTKDLKSNLKSADDQKTSKFGPKVGKKPEIGKTLEEKGNLTDEKIDDQKTSKFGPKVGKKPEIGKKLEEKDNLKDEKIEVKPKTEISKDKVAEPKQPEDKASKFGPKIGKDKNIIDKKAESKEEIAKVETKTSKFGKTFGSDKNTEEKKSEEANKKSSKFGTKFGQDIQTQEKNKDSKDIKTDVVSKEKVVDSKDQNKPTENKKESELPKTEEKTKPETKKRGFGALLGKEKGEQGKDTKTVSQKEPSKASEKAKAETQNTVPEKKVEEAQKTVPEKKQEEVTKPKSKYHAQCAEKTDEALKKDIQKPKVNETPSQDKNKTLVKDKPETEVKPDKNKTSDKGLSEDKVDAKVIDTPSKSNIAKNKISVEADNKVNKGVDSDKKAETVKPAVEAVKKLPEKQAPVKEAEKPKESTVDPKKPEISKEIETTKVPKAAEKDIPAKETVNMETVSKSVENVTQELKQVAEVKEIKGKEESKTPAKTTEQPQPKEDIKLTKKVETTKTEPKVASVVITDMPDEHIDFKQKVVTTDSSETATVTFSQTDEPITDIILALKDDDLDLSAELEANIAAASPEDEVKSQVIVSEVEPQKVESKETPGTSKVEESVQEIKQVDVTLKQKEAAQEEKKEPITMTVTTDVPQNEVKDIPAKEEMLIKDISKDVQDETKEEEIVAIKAELPSESTINLEKLENKQEEKPKVQPEIVKEQSKSVEKKEEKAETKPIEVSEVSEVPASTESEEMKVEVKAKSEERVVADEKQDETSTDTKKDPGVTEQKAEVKATEPVKKAPELPKFKPIPEEFYDTLFYFSGMGTVVGSALCQGVYVPQRATKTALDVEVIENYEAAKDEERKKDTHNIRTARTQAVDLSDELRKLQGLLGGLPNFADTSTTVYGSGGKRVGASVIQAPYHAFQPIGKPRRLVAPLDLGTSNLSHTQPGLQLISQRAEALAHATPPAPKLVDSLAMRKQDDTLSKVKQPTPMVQAPPPPRIAECPKPGAVTVKETENERNLPSTETKQETPAPVIAPPPPPAPVTVSAPVPPPAPVTVSAPVPPPAALVPKPADPVSVPPPPPVPVTAPPPQPPPPPVVPIITAQPPPAIPSSVPAPPVFRPIPKPMISSPANAAPGKENVPSNLSGLITGMMNGPTGGASQPLAPRENQPKSGGARPYGVYTSDPKMVEPSKPWQERYGTKSVEDLTNPKPYSQAGDIPTGLKPWQLSRLRGLEAKGYQFSHENPLSGADYSDSFYHGHTSLENSETQSFSPFLVSGRSQSVDREKKVLKAHEPAHSSTFNFAHVYGSHGEALPYCDV